MALLPFAYRLTKYDPAKRDASGAFVGDDWTSVADIGDEFEGERLSLARYLEVEAAHLAVIATFMAEAQVEALAVVGLERQPQQPLAVELAEGRLLAPLQVTDAVRHMLREQVWCRLERPGRFYIHVGFDYYTYVGCDQPTPGSLDHAAMVGLYVDEAFPSPHAPED